MDITQYHYVIFILVVWAMIKTAFVVWLVSENHSLQDTIGKLYLEIYYITKSRDKEPNKDTTPEDRDSTVIKHSK